MTENIKLPDELYVGLRQQGDGPNLAFIVPNGTDSAAIKRKSTVDLWARKYTSEYSYVNGQYTAIDKGSIPALVIKNELLEGYEISKEVRRTYWGGGNVVWRVLDPRGFEFEISSSNFARIVDCTDIKNGVIQGKCILGRAGANNLLLPENSEPYQDAVKVTAASKQSAVKKSDIQVGCEFTLNTSETAIFIGKIYVVHYGHTERNKKTDVGIYDYFKCDYSEAYAYLLDDVIFIRKDFKPIAIGVQKYSLEEIDDIVADKIKTGSKYTSFNSTTIKSYNIINIVRDKPTSITIEASEKKQTWDEIYDNANFCLKQRSKKLMDGEYLIEDTITFNYYNSVICIKVKLENGKVLSELCYDRYSYYAQERIEQDVVKTLTFQDLYVNIDGNKILFR